MSGASERANGQASGPVLTSRFLFDPDHSARGASMDVRLEGWMNGGKGQSDRRAKGGAGCRTIVGRIKGWTKNERAVGRKEIYFYRVICCLLMCNTVLFHFIFDFSLRYTTHVRIQTVIIFKDKRGGGRELWQRRRHGNELDRSRDHRKRSIEQSFLMDEKKKLMDVLPRA